jgi:hypothetical protein
MTNTFLGGSVEAFDALEAVGFAVIEATEEDAAEALVLLIGAGVPKLSSPSVESVYFISINNTLGITVSAVL